MSESASPLQPPTRGLVLGKFMPPHQGHQWLCDFARAYVDELAIVVGTMPNEPIDGGLRHSWMQELFPDCRVLHLHETLPQLPEEAESVEAFWEIWRTRLQALLPWPVDYVFASEAYGQNLATELGAEFIPVERQSIPVSGTAIRQDPMRHWNALPACVRPYYVRRICLFGPESCGKSTLARQLACHFATVHVPEYAQILLTHQQGELTETDLGRIARGQLAAEAALARQAHRLLFCDTDLLTTVLWSQELYGQVMPWIEAKATQQSYDLTLLCAPDVPWEDEVHRLRPHTREAFFERCVQILTEHQRHYTVLHGSWQTRWEQALSAIEALGSSREDA